MPKVSRCFQYLFLENHILYFQPSLQIIFSFATSLTLIAKKHQRIQHFILWDIPHTLKLVSPLSTSFVIATLRSTLFIQFTFPLLNQLFYNRNTLQSSKKSPLIPSLNASGNQRILRPTATFSRYRYYIKAKRNTVARAKGTQISYTESEFILYVPTNNDDELDNNLPSLEEQSRATLRLKILTKASDAGSTLQRLEQPALHWAGL